MKKNSLVIALLLTSLTLGGVSAEAKTVAPSTTSQDTDISTEFTVDTNSGRTDSNLLCDYVAVVPDNANLSYNATSKSFEKELEFGMYGKSLMLLRDDGGSLEKKTYGDGQMLINGYTSDASYQVMNGESVSSTGTVTYTSNNGLDSVSGSITLSSSESSFPASKMSDGVSDISQMPTVKYKISVPFSEDMELDTYNTTIPLSFSVKYTRETY